MLKATAERGKLEEDNLFIREIACQPGTPTWLLACGITRRIGPELEFLEDLNTLLTAQGKLFESLLKDAKSIRIDLKTSLMGASSAALARQFSLAELALSEIAISENPEQAWAKYAEEVERTEKVLNDQLTPQLAKQIVEAEAEFFKAMTPEQAKILADIELLVHRRFDDDRAKRTRNVEEHLGKSQTKSIVDSRERVRATFRKVLTDTPHYIEHLRHGAEVLGQAETEELRAARKQTESRANKPGA